MLNGFSKMAVLALPKIYACLLTRVRLSDWTVRELEIFFHLPGPHAFKDVPTVVLYGENRPASRSG